MADVRSPEAMVKDTVCLRLLPATRVTDRPYLSLQRLVRHNSLLDTFMMVGKPTCSMATLCLLAFTC